MTIRITSQTINELHSREFLKDYAQVTINGRMLSTNTHGGNCCGLSHLYDFNRFLGDRGEDWGYLLYPENDEIKLWDRDDETISVPLRKVILKTILNHIEGMAEECAADRGTYTGDSWDEEDFEPFDFEPDGYYKRGFLVNLTEDQDQIIGEVLVGLGFSKAPIVTTNSNTDNRIVHYIGEVQLQMN